jgi:hypothetical protein
MCVALSHTGLDRQKPNSCATAARKTAQERIRGAQPDQLSYEFARLLGGCSASPLRFFG